MLQDLAARGALPLGGTSVSPRAVTVQPVRQLQYTSQPAIESEQDKIRAEQAQQLLMAQAKYHNPSKIREQLRHFRKLKDAMLQETQIRMIRAKNETNLML